MSKIELGKGIAILANLGVIAGIVVKRHNQLRRAALISLWLVCSDLLAQEQDPIEELLALCETTRCYPAGSVEVTLDNGETAELGSSDYPFPMVHDDVVYVFPGKSFFVAAEIVDQALINMRAVDAPEVPKDVLMIRMWQEPGMPDTFLSVTNYFPMYVKYRAAMMLPEEDGLRETSSCPVMDGGRVSFEHWPYAIFQLVLVDFVVLDADTEELVCE